jgi:hypothetical protein
MIISISEKNKIAIYIGNKRGLTSYTVLNVSYLTEIAAHDEDEITMA